MKRDIVSSPRNRALRSLDGLSVGDALGERFFGSTVEVIRRIEKREMHLPMWRYTDDTEMAISIVDVLLGKDCIDPDLLAEKFAERYDPTRGYGSGAHRLLQDIRRGVSWREAAPAMFGGTGSFGNGAAMRIAPLGAYFADDLERLVEDAALSARVTHAHSEAVAGAVAVALAAAAAWRLAVDDDLDPRKFFTLIMERTPNSKVRDGIHDAAALSPDLSSAEAAKTLGCGKNISAQDTVPFVLWSAAHHMDDFEETFWTTVRGLGDRDTTCAMACGIVALSAPKIPETWLRDREKIPALVEVT